MRCRTRWWGVAILCPLLSLAFCGDAQGQLTLPEIIANVRQNEKLYADIEVVIHSAYDIGGREPANEREVLQWNHKLRFISQGDWFRLEREGSNRDSQQKVSLNRIRSFDGQTTRVYEQDAVGNIAHERLEDENFVKPHFLVRCRADNTVPFSVYLQGNEAIKAHPNGAGKWAERLSMRISYLGTADHAGLKCHKVLIDKVNMKSGEVHDSEEFWLAEGRNYLPVKLLACTHRFSKSVPIGEGVAGDLREIKPGVWFPHDIEFVAYDGMQLQQSGIRKVQWKERLLVERAALDPKYEREFFSTVNFPDGTAVYHLEHGKVTKSWRQGAPDTPGVPPHRSWRLWLWWVSGGFALAAVAIWIGVKKSGPVKDPRETD